MGYAAGSRLRVVRCANASCAEAMAACYSDPQCDTLAISTSLHRRGRRGRRSASESTTSATLRSSYVNWGSNAEDLLSEVTFCRKLAETARSGRIRPGEWAPVQRRALWREHFCDEYAAPRGAAIPDLGRSLSPSKETPHCPPTGTTFMVITYQNGPSPWLCTFLRTLAYRNVPVTVLGWQPREFSRLNNVFYFTDRVYTYLRYLRSCPTLSPNASLLFCDADELLQVGLDALQRRTAELYRSTGADVILSAEARCMPEKLGKLAWAHSVATAGVMHKKWPRCLNTGNWVGRASAIASMLEQICRPCQAGLDIDTIFRRYARAYSAQVRNWIYSEQAELMRLYLSRPSNETRWVLDYQQRLFHPNFWFNPQADTRVLRDGRIRNAHTGSLSAFIHYNGNSKVMWTGPHSPSALSAALRHAYQLRTGDADLHLLDDFIVKQVDFLGPSFQRDSKVKFAEVCSLGAI
ncbi:MAG: hypothetical protein SGPRY_000486 [Prymnesium sp.]